MKRTTPPAWLPKWRDARAYPVNLTLAEWRWQFLRRRQDYQKDFESLTDAHNSRFLVGKRVVSAIQKTATPALMKKYGVTTLLDPACPDVPQGYFPSAPAFNVQAGHEQADLWSEMGYTLCRIDLAAPLDQQLRGLKSALQQEARRRGIAPGGRREQKHWQRCLRVLDAYAAGEPPDAIIRKLHDLTAPNQTASAWRAAARKQQKILTGRSS